MATKIKVEVAKTVQERQYEPVSVRVSMERLIPSDDPKVLSDEIQDMSVFLQEEINVTLTNRGIE